MSAKHADVVLDSGSHHHLWVKIGNVGRIRRSQFTPREPCSGAFGVSPAHFGEVVVPNPANTLDSMIAAAKREVATQP